MPMYISRRPPPSSPSTPLSSPYALQFSNIFFFTLEQKTFFSFIQNIHSQTLSKILFWAQVQNGLMVPKQVG